MAPSNGREAFAVARIWLTSAETRPAAKYFLAPLQANFNPAVAAHNGIDSAQVNDGTAADPNELLRIELLGQILDWRPDQQIGGALGIAVMASIYAFAAVPGSYVSGLPAAPPVAHSLRWQLAVSPCAGAGRRSKPVPAPVARMLD